MEKISYGYIAGADAKAIYETRMRVGMSAVEQEASDLLVGLETRNLSLGPLRHRLGESQRFEITPGQVEWEEPPVTIFTE
jgi:hypothetical protein